MSASTFDARYKLLKCIAVSEGIRTHNAIELPTNRVVMVHLLDAAGPEAVSELQNQLGRLPEGDKSRVLEIATLPSGFAIVTEFLQSLKSFPEWLQERVLPDDGGAGGSDSSAIPIPTLQRTAAGATTTPGGAEESAAKPPPEPEKPAGEFTRLFGAQTPGEPAPVARRGTTEVAKPRPGTPEVPKPRTAAPAEPRPRPRRTTTVKSPLVSPPSPSPERAPAPPPPPAASLAPGEFTQMFKPPVAAPEGDVARSPFVTPPPETRRLDPSGGRGGVAPAPGSMSPLGTSAASAFPSPRVTDIPPLPERGPAPAPAAGGSPLGLSPAAAPPTPGSPLGVGSPLGSAVLPPLPPDLPPQLPPAMAGSPIASAGSRSSASIEPPGAYTQLIQQSVTPTPVPASAKPAATPEQPRRRIPLGLLIALNVVLLLTFVLILYFAFRPAAPQEGGAAAADSTEPGAALKLPKGKLAPPKLPPVPKAPALPR